MRVGSVVADGWKRLIGFGLVLLVTLGLSACGGSREASGNDVVVSGVGPSGTLVPGATAVFTMTVQNTGNNAAQDVKLTDQYSGTLVLTAFTCQAGGGAVCPALPSTSMTVPTLPPGGTLVFTLSFTVNANTSGTLSNQMAATTADDIGRLNNSATATGNVVVAVNSLGVTQDAALTAAAGGSTTFKVVVANPVGGTATNNVVLQWGVTAPFALDGITYTCTASGGATCPADQSGAASMTFNIPSMALAHQLTFVFSVPIPSSGRGNLVSAASVTGVGDGDPSNNQSSFTTVATDARNGVYQAYAADGRLYQLTIDFDANSYTMAGNGTSDTRTFTAEPGGTEQQPSDNPGGYRVGNSQRLRTASDLIVGSHAFSAGVLPYVAARKFATNIAGLPARMNLMLRSSQPDGSQAVTRAATVGITGNVLTLCQDDFDATQAASCGVTTKSYLLTLLDDVFTATDSTDATKSFSFRLARSGGADILLAAGTTPGASTLQLVVGLAESSALTPVMTYGPAVYPGLAPDWAQIELPDATGYTVTGSVVDGLSALFRLDNTSPTSMLQGAAHLMLAGGAEDSLPALDGAPIWVMQGYPLVVVFGATLSAVDQANASGLLQISLP